MFPRLDSGQDGRVSKEEFLSDNLRATLEIVRIATTDRIIQIILYSGWGQ